MLPVTIIVDVDGVFVRPGDKAALEPYFVIVDARGRILGVRVEEKDAVELARKLGAGLVPPAKKKRTLAKLDPMEKLIREALDEV